MAISKSCGCGQTLKQFVYVQKSQYKNKVYRYNRVGYYCADCARRWRKGHLSISRMYGRVSNSKKSLVIREAKNKPCADCSILYPYYCMDFDHLGDKKWNIGQDYTRIGIKELLKEIAKCEVVCSNCHRKRTYDRTHEKRIDNGEVETE